MPPYWKPFWTPHEHSEATQLGPRNKKGWTVSGPSQFLFLLCPFWTPHEHNEATQQGPRNKEGWTVNGTSQFFVHHVLLELLMNIGRPSSRGLGISRVGNPLICSKLLILMSNCEQLAQIAQDKRATESESLRLLTKSEQPWAICASRPPKISNCEQIIQVTCQK